MGRKRIVRDQPEGILNQVWGVGRGRKSLVHLLETAGLQGVGRPDVVVMRQRYGEEGCRHNDAGDDPGNALAKGWTFHGCFALDWSATACVARFTASGSPR